MSISIGGSLHGIHCVDICGEKLSADNEASERFWVCFNEYISRNDCDPEQVYNVDTASLDYKKLPEIPMTGPDEQSAPLFKVV